MHHGWTINTGAYGKWLQRFLPPDVWDAYVRTYAAADYAEIWDALFNTCHLARVRAMPRDRESQVC